jgi:hypothetical protein
MSNEIVNITRYVVYRKIDDIIKNPNSPYDSAFANPYLRQKLLLRVLNDTNPHYAASAPSQELDPDRIGQFPIAREDEKQIDSTIQENILRILQEEDAIQYFCAVERALPSPEPSHWFG